MLRSSDGGVSHAGSDEAAVREQAAGSPAQLRTDLAAESGAIDRLTGLMSKNEYLRVMPELFRQSRERGGDLSLAIVDIDNFKVANDTQGHQFGDRLLGGIAAMIRRSVRPGDVAVRFGGEEIVLVVRGDVHEAAGLAERIRKQCRDLTEAKQGKDSAEPVIPSGSPAPVGTVSVGVAQGLGRGVAEACDSEEQLLARADTMLYLAKNSGRNRVVVMVDELRLPLSFNEYVQYRRYVARYPHADRGEVLGHFSDTSTELTYGGYSYEHYVRMQKQESA